MVTNIAHYEIAVCLGEAGCFPATFLIPTRSGHPLRISFLVKMSSLIELMPLYFSLSFAKSTINSRKLHTGRAASEKVPNMVIFSAFCLFLVPVDVHGLLSGVLSAYICDIKKLTKMSE